MVLRVSNDNSEPDAHGQAAILLIESLMHGLIGKSVISVADAIEIVDVAAEVKAEVAVELGESRATMKRSLMILKLISDSLRTELADGTVDGAPQA